MLPQDKNLIYEYIQEEKGQPFSDNVHPTQTSLTWNWVIWIQTELKLALIWALESTTRNELSKTVLKCNLKTQVYHGKYTSNEQDNISTCRMAQSWILL